MKDQNDYLYTTGEFARKAGVTLRTLRYYDNIGLLKPSCYNKNGIRLYNSNDFAKLQKILTLKYIGLSLKEIKNVIKFDIDNKDFIKSLEIQKEVMNGKARHIKRIINAIDETLDMLSSNKSVNWDKFVNIIKIINIDHGWMEQYENASNLRARIKIHELFSTNKTGWMQWYFDNINIPENSKILELGCGDGSFWIKNIKKISPSWDIALTDFSPGMLKDAESSLKNYNKKFSFKIVDAESIPYGDEAFDVVFANHLLYHVPDMEKALSEIQRVLKPGGLFYTSTVGKNHMIEMRKLISEFDSDIITTKSFKTTYKFNLENGTEMLSKHFSNISIKRYNDNLNVTEAIPLIDYIFSMPGNVKSLFDDEKLNSLTKFIEYKIKKNSGIFISKDTGFFKCNKL